MILESESRRVASGGRKEGHPETDAGGNFSPQESVQRCLSFRHTVTFLFQFGTLIHILAPG